MFRVDKRIKESSFFLCDWPLSSLFLKNEALFPWLILVPRRQEVTEFYQLNQQDSQQLMTEIRQASKIMTKHFAPQKLNIANLGNIVAQLHIHIVARYETDAAWPHSIWQPKLASACYKPAQIAELMTALQNDLRAIYC